MAPDPVRLRLIVGPVGSGKTTRARDRAREQTLKGRKVAGVLARKTPDGRVLHDLATGDETPLEHAGPDEATVSVGRFRFRQAAFDWAVDRIGAGLAAGCDVVILDEVGPLELRGEGFAALLDRLATWPGERVLLVRQELVDAVLARFGSGIGEASLLREEAP